MSNPNNNIIISEDGNNDSTLLEALRQGRLGSNPVLWLGKEEALKTMKRHSHEFPPRIERILSEQREDTDSQWNDVTAKVGGMLFPHVRNQVYHNDWDPWEGGWQGLDDALETEDQVETMIRFFPDFLECSVLYHPSYPVVYNGTSRTLLRPGGPGTPISVLPVHIILARPNSISFLPLFFKLSNHPEIKNPSNYKLYQKLIVEFLFTNIYRPHGWKRTDILGLFGQGIGFLEPDLSEKSLLVLRGLEEDARMLFRYRDYMRTSQMLARAIEDWPRTLSQASFFDDFGLDEEERMNVFEPRLRLLVEWCPSLLERSWLPGLTSPMLSLYSLWRKFHYPQSLSQPQLYVNEHKRRLALVVVELGMYHYPEMLGFCFSKEVNVDVSDRLELQNHFCKLLEEKISDEKTDVVPFFDSLCAHFRHNPKALLPASLYTLVRQNPLRVLKNDRSNEQQRMRKALARCLEENERLRNQMESTEEENNSLRDLMESAERENGHLRNRMESAEEENHWLRHYRESTDRENDRLREEIRHLRAQRF